MIITIKRLIWNMLIKLGYLSLTKVYAMNVHKSVKIGIKVKLDET